MIIPKIKVLGEGNDFHDSSLIDIKVESNLANIYLIISTPDNYNTQCLWQIKFFGVMRVEYETVGDGIDEDVSPIEIYEIYENRESDEYYRWTERARNIGITEEIHHIVLASSFIRGWGKNENLEGITIVCQGWTIEPASPKYKGKEYYRPRIEAGSGE